MSIRFSANLGFLWKDLPPFLRVNRAQDCGFDAIEFHDDPVTDPHPEEIFKAVEGTGLPVLAINTPMGDTYGTDALNSLYSPDETNLIWETIQAANKLKAQGIHITSGISRDGHVPEHYIGALQYVLEHFDGYVYIEPLSHQAIPNYYMHQVEQAAAICEHLGNDKLRILFDCYHVRHESKDVIGLFKQYIHYIGHVQISSFPSRNEPDTGLLDYHELVPEMFKAGYSGMIGCEYNPTTMVEDGLHWMDEFRELASAAPAAAAEAPSAPASTGTLSMGTPAASKTPDTLKF